MKKLLLAVLMVGATAYADDTIKGPPDFYKCRLLVVAKDLANGSVEKAFTAIGQETESHGGKTYMFEFEPHKIGLLASGRWMAISWARGEEPIGSTMIATAEFSQASRAMFLYNPKDPSEFIAVECSPEKK